MRSPNRTVALVAIAGAVNLTGCNDHTFKVYPPCTVEEIQVPVEIPSSPKTDLLFVIDNSGSMCEEQQRLKDAFFLEGCILPASLDFDDIDAAGYANPTPETLQLLAQTCGFIQILATYDLDFRVGVITTDTSSCDDILGFASNASLTCGNPRVGDRRPQRGCLQGPTGETKKFLERQDDGLKDKFADILENISVVGTGFERGLDATRFFLDPNADRDIACTDDQANFIRGDAQLVVVYLTDEEDCSHVDDPSCTSADDDCFPFEKANSHCLPEAETLTTVPAALCYERQDLLTPVSDYVGFLRAYKGPERADDVRVAVIAGGIYQDGTTTVIPDGCSIGSDQLPEGGCTDPQGLSNLAGTPGTRCHPDTLDGAPACCQADPGGRYFELANSIGPGQGLADSICFGNFSDTMLKIVQFAAGVATIALAQEPASPDAVIVKVTSAGSDESRTLVNGTDYTVNGATITFTPPLEPGDTVQINALANGDNVDPDENCQE